MTGTKIYWYKMTCKTGTNDFTGTKWLGFCFSPQAFEMFQGDLFSFRKAFEFYLNKLTKNGIMILEGGSISRDNVYWMNKYNKPKIIPVLEKYKNKINIKTIGDFPSITLVTKL